MVPVAEPVVLPAVPDVQVVHEMGAAAAGEELTAHKAIARSAAEPATERRIIVSFGMRSDETSGRKQLTSQRTADQCASKCVGLHKYVRPRADCSQPARSRWRLSRRSGGSAVL